MNIKTINRNQQGSALMISMIMIFMMSIMGISAMKGSSLERRMATNAVQSAAAFQVAESLTDFALNTPANMTKAVDAAPDAFLVDDIDLKTAFTAQQGVTVQFIGNSSPIGYSIGVGSGNGFTALNFVVEGGAIIDDARTASAVTQGAYRVAPGQ